MFPFHCNRHACSVVLVAHIYTTWETALEAIFTKLSHQVVVKDRDTGRSKGFGFVRYTNEEDAQKAISAMNNVE